MTAFASPGELHGAQARVNREAGMPPRLDVRVGLAASGECEPPLLTDTQLEALFRTVGAGLVRLSLGETSNRSAERRHQDALSAELAGSFLAHACVQFDCVAGFARHHETGETLPAELFAKLREARQRDAHLRAAQRLELELFDLRIHRDYVPDEIGTQLRDQVLDTFMQVRREQSVLPLPYWTRLANTCLPLFAGDESARLWHRTWTDEVGADLFRAASEADFAEPYLQRLAQQLWTASPRPLAQRLGEVQGQLLAQTG